ncbi:MAG: NADH-quinone oxidoreductase subunit J [Bacteroidota bacterium]|nr:NADH-quinone oxidoreductase subunit J [Bacteroidota bacterium]
MNLEIILFILFSVIAAASAVIMITRANPIISALFLVLNFACLAGLYLLLNAQFIAVTQIIVYAGAIMVLFLFVIMLLRPEHDLTLQKKSKIKFMAAAAGIFVFAQLVYIIFFFSPNASQKTSVQSSINSGTIEQIGTAIFTKYVIPFEAAGYLLLAAAIGALVLAKKKFE